MDAPVVEIHRALLSLEAFGPIRIVANDGTSLIAARHDVIQGAFVFEPEGRAMANRIAAPNH